jgi:hypothetical protein
VLWIPVRARSACFLHHTYGVYMAIYLFMDKLKRPTRKMGRSMHSRYTERCMRRAFGATFVVSDSLAFPDRTDRDIQIILSPTVPTYLLS